MFACVLKSHQVHHVDEPHLQFGKVLTQQIRRRERFEGGHVAGRGDHHVGGLTGFLGAGPFPDAQTAGAVCDRLLHGQEVGVRLLARHDDVDVLARPQAVVIGGQQGVGIRWQVHPNHGCALVHHMVDETRILMTESVVVLTPDMAGEKVIQAGDRSTPRDRVGNLEPFGMLVEHRVDDVDERLVAVEQTVPTGQQITLEPTLALVFGQHLDHPAGTSEMVVHLGPEELGVPLLVGGIEHRLESVGCGLVGPEDPEVVRVEPNHVGQPLAEHLGGLGQCRTRCGYVDGVIPEVGQTEILE